jgi:hypothetical protein
MLLFERTAQELAPYPIRRVCREKPLPTKVLYWTSATLPFKNVTFASW